MASAAVNYSTHPWTFRLVALNLIIYLMVETGIGFSSNETLSMIGWFEPQAIIAGQWWRLLTSSLLHADFMHLIFNMIAMLIFGSMLEKIAGPALYLFVYFVGGLLANLMVLLVLVSIEKPYLSLGSSGSVMAIIGASFSCALYIFYRTRLEYWRMFFIRMSIIIGIQFLIDALLPANAMMVHVAGGISGMLLGWMVVWIRVGSIRTKPS